MKQAEQAVNFEQVLLSHVEMCYSVALALTRNPDRAEALARYALTWAWRWCESPDDQKDLKRKLLRVLRERFLQHYCHTPCSLRNEAELAEEDSICIAQNAERNTECISRGVRTVM